MSKTENHADLALQAATMPEGQSVQAVSAQAVTALSVLELVNWAQSQEAKGLHHEAAHAYSTWLAVHGQEPSAGAVHFNLGVVWARLGNARGAALCYQEALRLMPQLWQARVNMGLLFENAGQLDEALKQWQAAWPDASGQKTLLNHMVRLGERKGDLMLAQRQAMASLALDPDQPDVIQHLMWTRRRMCAWPSLPPALDVLGVNVAQARMDMGPFVGLAELDDPAQQLQATRRFVERRAECQADLPALVRPVQGLPALGAEATPTASAPAKLRLGYLSGDFKWHVVSILMAEVFELHDRSQVTVIGLDYSETVASPMRARVLAAFDEHVPLHGLTDTQAAERIAQARVDVLVDLTGLTAGARLGIVPLRPARLQVSYLGFMGSSAMPGMDAILVDSFLMPPELVPHFTERPLYLDVYQANDRKRLRPPAMSRAAAGLPEGAFVLCAFNNNYKITEALWARWMRILLRLHAQGVDARLWVSFDSLQVQLNLRAALQAAGVPEDWVIWAVRVNPDQYLARLQSADLFLDTSPYGAGVTCSDALWVGLPVLTCPGRTLASRMAGSLLHAVGLPELIAQDGDDYENLAVRMGTDRAWAQALRRKLKELRETCALFDTPKFVKNLEAVLKQALADVDEACKS